MTTSNPILESHFVELLPDENAFQARRRWLATRPKGSLSPIYIR